MRTPDLFAGITTAQAALGPYSARQRIVDLWPRLRGHDPDDRARIILNARRVLDPRLPTLLRIADAIADFAAPPELSAAVIHRRLGLGAACSEWTVRAAVRTLCRIFGTRGNA